MASTGEPWRLGQQPELHGVRGIAILFVVVGHALVPYGGGPLAAAGVTVFFVLSGFLITSLLLVERQRAGRISLRRFYTRRMTRLAPPLVAMVLLGVVFARSITGAVPALTWLGNYAWILSGRQQEPFGVTWSLGVEEQFYLLWPVALIALGSRRRAVRVTAVAAVLFCVWRSVLLLDGHLVYAYAALETAGSPILIGCLIALTGWRLRSRWAGGVSLLLIVAVGLAASMVGGDAWYVVPAIVTPAAAALVASAEASPWLGWRPRNLRLAPLSLAWCGVASYSIYLWHASVSMLLAGSLTPAGVGVGVVCGIVAYLGLEAPLMQWRRRHDSRSASGEHQALDPRRVVRAGVDGARFAPRDLLVDQPHGQRVVAGDVA